MLKVALFFFCFQYVVSENNNGNNENKYIFERRNKNSYYFRLGRNNNEVKVNNRIYFLNHNISDLEYPNGRVENMKKMEEKVTHVSTKKTYKHYSMLYL